MTPMSWACDCARFKMRWMTPVFLCSPFSSFWEQNQVSGGSWAGRFGSLPKESLLLGTGWGLMGFFYNPEGFCWTASRPEGRISHGKNAPDRQSREFVGKHLHQHFVLINSLLLEKPYSCSFRSDKAVCHFMSFKMMLSFKRRSRPVHLRLQATLASCYKWERNHRYPEIL